MAITVSMQVASITSSALTDTSPALDRITEGLRSRKPGAPDTETAVYLQIPNHDDEAWWSPGTLSLTFAGEPTLPFAVGDTYDITITPAGGEPTE